MNSFPKIRNSLLSRPGFTLVELLLVMAIIAVLASLSLAVIGDSQYNAQRNATQSRVNQISSVLEEALEEYSVARLPVGQVEGFIDPVTAGNDIRAYARQVSRRVMLDVINFEMPRGYDSIALNNNPSNNNVASYPSPHFVQWYNDNSSLFQPVGGNTLLDALQGNVTFKADQFRIPDADESAYPHANELNPNSPSAIIRSNSEYLYAILQRTQSQGILAIESLSQRAFADTDGDTFLEVVDSWGNPIGFYFEMYDDNGNLLNPTVLPSPSMHNPNALAADLDPGFWMNDDTVPQYPTAHFGTPARNIRIKVYSTGNKSVDDFGVINTFTDWFTFINSVDTLVSN